MEKNLLNAVLEHNMEKTIQGMILPSRNFTGGSYPYEVNLRADAIDYKNLLIRTDVWMDNILSFDGFTDQVNNFIYDYEKKNGSAFDYILFEELENAGYEVREEIGGYTYNDPDTCRLSRDIHYTTFYSYDSNDYYVIMMVHYGADARAGFSNAACFKLDDFDYFFLSMELTGYTESMEERGDEELQWYEVDNGASYDKEKDTWYHDETKEEVYLHTSANGW